MNERTAREFTASTDIWPPSARMARLTMHVRIGGDRLGVAAGRAHLDRLITRGV